MLQYKIPQNIGIADKIVGPFSLKQLIIVAVGGGISYVIFTIASRMYELNILEYIVICLPLLISLAVALIKINDITFTKFILLTLEFAIRPKKRMWDHRGISQMVAVNFKEELEEDNKNHEIKKTVQKKVNLRNLSQILNSGGFKNQGAVIHRDMDEVQDDDLITEAFFGNKRAESKTQNMYWRTKESQKKRLELLAKIPSKAFSKNK